MRMKLLIFPLMLAVRGTFAQEDLQTNISGGLNISSRVEEVKKYDGELRELKILAPTLLLKKLIVPF